MVHKRGCGKRKDVRGELFECISPGGALGVEILNSATPLIQTQPRRLPHGKYVLHWLGCSQENDQLLREGWKRPDSCRRQDSSNALRPGPMDEDSPPAVDGSDGSHPLHRLDLR